MRRRADTRPADGALDLDFSAQRGDFRLAATLSVVPGEILGVIGPNGAGKSSLIGAVAGTLPIRSGTIRVGNRALSEAIAGRRPRHIARADRFIGHLDQRARLFPHLSARENVAFGPRSHGASRPASRHLAERWLTRVGLAGRGDARPHELSGGQQQRVAIARTLAARPAVVLLDEPFAALDVESAVDLRALVLAELRALDVPAILVTHDPVDLLSLADRVGVIESGRVQQIGSVGTVLGAPATAFTARFAGRVLLTGTSSGSGTLLLDDAPMPELAGSGDLPPRGRAAFATYDPRLLTLEMLATDAEIPTGTPLPEPGTYRWTDRIAALTPTHSGLSITGERWPRFTVDLPLTTAATAHLRVGAPISCELRARDVRFAAIPSSHPASVE